MSGNRRDSANLDRRMSHKMDDLTNIDHCTINFNDTLKISDIKTAKRDPLFLYWATFSASLVHLSATMGLTWTSPVMPQLETANNPLGYSINASQKSWISSLLFIGAIFGPLISVKMADVIGRKKTLICLAFPILIADFTLAFASEIYLYYIARFIHGLSNGSVLAVLPMYINEITENHNRGKYSCITCIFAATGALYPYLVGPYVNIQTFCLTCTFPVFLFLITFYTFMPDTPQYLILKNREAEATKSLMKLRNKSQKEVQKEILELTLIIQNTSDQQAGIKQLFSSPGLRRGVLISLGLVIFQQLSGTNVVLGYLQPIFEATGTSIDPNMSAILVGVVQLLTAFVTTALVERFGRKSLLVTSAIIGAVSITLLGIYFLLQKQNINVGSLWWLPLVSVLGYIISFNLGLGPLPWTVSAEIFPTSVKSAAGSLTSSVCFFTSSIVLFAFPLLSEILGMAECFLLFGGFVFIAIVFICIVVPETKQRSIIDIQNELSGKNDKAFEYQSGAD